MSKLPDLVETSYETNEGQTISRSEFDILDDLVQAFNQLVTYLKETRDD